MMANGILNLVQVPEMPAEGNAERGRQIGSGAWWPAEVQVPPPHIPNNIFPLHRHFLKDCLIRSDCPESGMVE